MYMISNPKVWHAKNLKKLRSVFLAFSIYIERVYTYVQGMVTSSNKYDLIYVIYWC